MFGGRGDLAAFIAELHAPSDNVHHFVESLQGEKQTQSSKAERAAAYKSIPSQKGDGPDSEFWLPQAVGNF